MKARDFSFVLMLVGKSFHRERVCCVVLGLLKRTVARVNFVYNVRTVKNRTPREGAAGRPATAWKASQMNIKYRPSFSFSFSFSFTLGWRRMVQDSMVCHCVTSKQGSK